MEFIKPVAAFLKQHGYRKRGNTFSLSRDENLGMINFQQSTSNTKASGRFTINIGIWSAVLSRMDRWRNADVNPGIIDCQWSCRLSSLMPEQTDLWWDLNISAAEVTALLERYAFPVLDRYISDKALTEYWLNGGYAVTTEWMRLVHLTTLLKVHGDERYAAVAAEFLEYATTQRKRMDAEEHLAILKKHNF